MLTVDLLIDSQEKQPYTFPKTMMTERGLLVVNTERADLRPWGCDYCLRDAYSGGRVERKKLGELLKNLDTADKHRQGRSFTKLKDGCAEAYLMMSMGLSDLGREYYAGPYKEKVPGWQVLSMVTRAMVRQGLTLIIVPRQSSRTNNLLCGEFCVRLLLDAAWRNNVNPTHEVH